MAEKINIPQGPWAWSGIGGDLKLVTKHGGAKVVLCAGRYHRLQTRDPETGWLRELHPDSHLARAIEALPELIAALRPQLNAEAREEVEALAEAYEACAGKGDARLASALRFLLERQDAARRAVDLIAAWKDGPADPEADNG